jgi:predicted ATPase
VTSDPGLQFRAVDAFTDLLENLALAGPLVLAVDVLQWADPSSLLTLASVMRRLCDLPIALIGSFRPIPRTAALDQLVTALRAAGAQKSCGNCRTRTCSNSRRKRSRPNPVRDC